MMICWSLECAKVTDVSRGGKAKFTTRIMVEIPNNWGGDLWRQLRKCRWFQPQPMCHTKIPKILGPFSNDYTNSSADWIEKTCFLHNMKLSPKWSSQTPNWVWCKNKSLCCSKGKSIVEPTKNNLQHSPKTLLCLPPQAPIIALLWSSDAATFFFSNPFYFWAYIKTRCCFANTQRNFKTYWKLPFGMIEVVICLAHGKILNRLLRFRIHFWWRRQF